MELESLHLDLERNEPRSTVVEERARTADLEMAVLVQVRPGKSKFGDQRVFTQKSVFCQELMSMREERADLRAQVYLLEREKRGLEMLANSQRSQVRNKDSAFKFHSIPEKSAKPRTRLNSRITCVRILHMLLFSF